MKKVKITWAITICFAALCTLTAFKISVHTNSMSAEEVDKFYLKHLNLLQSKLQELRISCEKGENLLFIQNKFKQCRLSYKKAAVLIDQFNIVDEILLNGPPIDRVEEDHPDDIIHPGGFQVIEQLIFNKNFTAHDQVISEVDKMSAVISKLKTEPDRVNKFSDAAVFDAIQNTLIKIITVGTTGFDSPIASHSISETASVAEGLEELFAIYTPALQKKNPLLTTSFNSKLSVLKNYLKNNRDFKKFDRFIFIVQYANPLYDGFVELRKSAGWYSNGASPVNFQAKSVFGKDFFNVDFFSPGNGYQVTQQRITLGKLLFNDPILSGTKNRSCASCHKPELAFTDGLRTPLAIDNSTSLSRNTPGLWNSALQTRQFFDSRADILENQLDEVVHNAREMKGSLKQSVTDLKNDPHYLELFRKAYPQNKEPVVAFNIANAIASYVRSLVALNSKFDRAMRGEAKLMPNEKNGFNLFMGKARCASCHFLPLFNGLAPPQFSRTESEVIGVPKSADRKNSVLDGDEGKFVFTKSAVDRFAFKTPGLRNIELTAPYMHNGVFSTLEEVVKFYNDGGGKGLKIAPANQTLPFERLNLSPREIADIVVFMKTLTDTVPHFTAAIVAQ